MGGEGGEGELGFAVKNNEDQSNFRKQQWTWELRETERAKGKYSEVERAKFEKLSSFTTETDSFCAATDADSDLVRE